MKKYLERLAFTAVLGALIATGWFAIETEASSPPRPELVEVAVAAPVAVDEPVIIPEAADEPQSAAAPAAVAVPASQSLFRSLPEVPAIDVDAAIEVAAPAPAAPAAAAPADEQLATTSEDDTDEPIIVEHTIAAIPDPPDVGASDRRETFEVEADPDVHDPWLGVRNCESHNNYSINTGNGFYGAYQFTISSWDWVAGLIGRPDLIGVRPDLAAPWDQDRLAQALAFEVAGGGLGHWPVCGRFYG